MEREDQGAGRWHTTRKTVLVVEENMAVHGLGGRLRHAGYHVLEASSIDDALDLVAAGRRIDMLLAEYRIHGVSGVQLAQFIRDRLPQIPVLITTSSREAACLHGRENPTIVCRARPGREDELADIVAGMLGEYAA